MPLCSREGLPRRAHRLEEAGLMLPLPAEAQRIFHLHRRQLPSLENLPRRRGPGPQTWHPPIPVPARAPHRALRPSLVRRTRRQLRALPSRIPRRPLPLIIPLHLFYSRQRAEEASEGMRQSPRGERQTLPTFGPSGMHERLNC